LPADQPEESRLAGAAGAQDRDDLAARDREIDSAQNFPVAVGELQARDLN
jgi:hypothetical protein